MIRIFFLPTAAVLLLSAAARAQQHRRNAIPAVTEDHGPLKRVYFNLYADSIKPVLNFYVNVEGEYSDGRVLPMDPGTVNIAADSGEMAGMEWLVKAGMPRYEKVTFTVTARENPALHDRVTVWMKKSPDPADAEIMRQSTSGRR